MKDILIGLLIGEDVLNYKVEVLCPNSWADGICDSYESRVYLEHEAKDYKDIILWLSKAVNHLNTLDPEYHGYRFEIYIDHEYRGEINTMSKTFELSFKFKASH